LILLNVSPEPRPGSAVCCRPLRPRCFRACPRASSTRAAAACVPGSTWLSGWRGLMPKHCSGPRRPRCRAARPDAFVPDAAPEPKLSSAESGRHRAEINPQIKLRAAPS